MENISIRRLGLSTSSGFPLLNIFNYSVVTFRVFFLKKMAIFGHLFHLFSVFSNNTAIFETNKCEKRSIEHTVLGFEPTTSWSSVSSHDHFTRAPVKLSMYYIETKICPQFARLRFRRNESLDRFCLLFLPRFCHILRRFFVKYFFLCSPLCWENRQLQLSTFGLFTRSVWSSNFHANFWNSSLRQS